MKPKKVAIMQPYFLPYIGYWQLINSVDEFVIYDNIEFTKKGWFNRNRILDGDHDRLFTIPLKKDSDYLPVNQRYLSGVSQAEIDRTLRIIENTYRKAPQFSSAFPLIEKCFKFSGQNLFDYIFNSINLIHEHLGLSTPIVVSSTVTIDHNLKGAEKVLAICKAQAASTYVNAIGGTDLYDAQEFQSNDIELKFIKANDISYKQFDDPFVPGLSIIDVLMFNDQTQVKRLLEAYTLI